MEAETNESNASGVLKAYLVLAALAAIAVGFILPIPHKAPAPPKASQFATFEVGSG